MTMPGHRFTTSWRRNEQFCYVYVDTFNFHIMTRVRRVVSEKKRSSWKDILSGKTLSLFAAFQFRTIFECRMLHERNGKLLLYVMAQDI